MTNDHKSGTPSPQNITGSKSTVTSTGRPPTTSILRSAMYYQNRIIIPEKKRSPTQPATNAQNAAQTMSNRAGSSIGSGANARPTSLQHNSNSAINRSATDAHASISEVRTIQGNNVHLADDTMDSAGIDIVVTDTENKQHRVKKKSIFARFFMCLQDNRMKGNPNAAEILASSNPQEYRILKKVLNTTFLSIGIALLIAVIIVIIYSSIGKFSLK